MLKNIAIRSAIMISYVASNKFKVVFSMENDVDFYTLFREIKMKYKMIYASKYVYMDEQVFYFRCNSFGKSMGVDFMMDTCSCYGDVLDISPYSRFVGKEAMKNGRLVVSDGKDGLKIPRSPLVVRDRTIMRSNVRFVHSRRNGDT